MTGNDRQTSIGVDGIDRRALLNGAAVVGGATLAGALIPGAAQAAQLPGDGEVVRYSLLIDGTEVAAFSELSGLITEIEPNEYLNSGSPINLKRVKPPSAILSRGVTQSVVLWTWHGQVLSGDPAARKTCSLVGFGQAGEPLIRFSLENAWPAKLELGSAEAGESQVVVETVTLIMDRLERVSP